MRINNENTVKSVCEDMKILGGKEIFLKNASGSDGYSLQSMPFVPIYKLAMPSAESVSLNGLLKTSFVSKLFPLKGSHLTLLFFSVLPLAPPTQHLGMTMSLFSPSFPCSNNRKWPYLGIAREFQRLQNRKVMEDLNNRHFKCISSEKAQATTHFLGILTRSVLLRFPFFSGSSFW